MKKIFVICLIIGGLGVIIQGIFNFSTFHFDEISKDNMAFDLGHDLGHVIARIAKILLGIVFIKLGMGWLSDEKKADEKSEDNN